MNSDDVFDILERVGATGSRAEKEALLAEQGGESLFLHVLTYALDPFRTYGIGKLPVVKGHGDEVMDGALIHRAWGLLDQLAARDLTGNAARDAVEVMMTAFTEKSATLFGRILLKDLRCGFTKNTVNKVFPGMIPSFDCMLAHKFEPKRVTKWPMLVEPKLDGVRVLAFFTEGRVRFFSRSGKEFTTFDHLKAPLMALAREVSAGRQMVFDGEVVSGSFNKTISEVRRSSEQATDARLNVFDVVPPSLFKKFGKDRIVKTPFNKRRAMLMAIKRRLPEGSPIRIIPQKSVNSVDEIMAAYQAFRDAGLEGAIVKDPNGAYACKRSYGWMKIKAEETVDVRVKGAFEGSGKYEGMLGGLIVDVDGVEVRVGGGFSDDQRREFWKAWHSDVGHPCYGEDPATWPAKLAGRLVEVEYHEKTPDGSLRHPRFIRFRDDKDMKEAA